MALSAYWSELTGEKQGKYKGGCIQKGREGWIEIIASNHTIISPRDPASGQATGKRSHKPIRTRHYYDQSLPMWYMSLCTNEAIKSATIAYFSPNKLGTAGGQGVETLTYEIKLTNAHVAEIEFEMLNNKNTELMKYEDMFITSVVYQKIEGTWKLGNKVWQDDWLAPV
ncbi:MAG: type VI secretion system tube protein TssD [Polyangiaceae bacterium]